MSQHQRRKNSHKRKPSPIPIPLLLGLGGLALIAVAALAFWGGDRSKAPKAEIEVTGAPSLKVDQEVVDLGDVKLGQTVEVAFQLTNVGDKPLQFTEEPYIEVKEGC
jgi:hypothetical protein